MVDMHKVHTALQIHNVQTLIFQTTSLKFNSRIRLTILKFHLRLFPIVLILLNVSFLSKE
jgi:hypothetical protein